MYLNISEINHYDTSFTRIYMAILMVAPMAVVMILMIGEIYPEKKNKCFYYSRSHFCFC